jgi:hypothetical protein
MVIGSLRKPGRVPDRRGLPFSLVVLKIGPPIVPGLNPTGLSIRQSLSGGVAFATVCDQTNVPWTGVNGRMLTCNRAWNFLGGVRQKSAVQNITSNAVEYSYNRSNDFLRLFPGADSCQQLTNRNVQLNPDSSGKFILVLNVTI